MTEAISRTTEDGIVFRVDLDLRPDGRSGPIVNSLHAAELYYQTFGRSWERNAMLKARAGAGDEPVGEALLQALEPFIWRKSLDLEVVGEIHAMKARIDARAGAEGASDLKLGKGGIREGEFFVSALQLLHGGKPGGKALRERSVLVGAGPAPLRRRGAVARSRRARRRLPLPAPLRAPGADGGGSPDPPAPAARRSGCRWRAPWATPPRRSSRRRSRPTASGWPRSSPACWAPPARRPRRSTPSWRCWRTRRWSRSGGASWPPRRGLQDPDRAVAAIDAMARRPTPFSRMGDPAVAVGLLSDALETPDPDQALSHLSDFAAALHDPAPYFKLLGERRRAARLLLSLFGTSDFLSKRFLRHPELIDALLRADQVELEKSAEAFGVELDERLEQAGGEGLDDRLERRLGELRRYKDEEILRIALHDIAGSIDLSSVARQLTNLAEALLVRCLMLAEVEAEAKGYRPPGRLCVIGMGKLGGRELGYHSDLDLIFLYPGGAEAGYERYPRLAQRFMAFLQMPLREGRLYQIDTRLRPSGNQGALVIGADAFARYHVGDAVPLGGGSEARPGTVRSQLWERQALLRARYVAGDVALWKKLEAEVITPVAYGVRADRAALAAEIRTMRERMESQLGRESTRGKNPKTGRGGLVDVEFAAQFLQLAHGHDHPAVRTSTTPVALARLRNAGLLRPADYEPLAAGYEFLRRVELRLRIVHDYGVDHLPESGPALHQLARRLGYFGEAPGDRFVAEYDRMTRAVREAFDRVVQ